jgi:hypothetical protein
MHDDVVRSVLAGFGGREVETAGDSLQRGRIRECLEARLAPWRRGDRYTVPAPIKMASGRNPDEP